MSGGYTAWKAAGYRWVQDHQFTPEQATRYSRHFLLPEVGEEGQAKLLKAKALLIGAGGLGEFIFRGVASVNNDLILAGAVPAAVLALAADVGLGAVERWLRPAA